MLEYLLRQTIIYCIKDDADEAADILVPRTDDSRAYDHLVGRRDWHSRICLLGRFLSSRSTCIYSLISLKATVSFESQREDRRPPEIWS